MKATIERLQLLQENLLQPNFFNKKGLGNEMSFYIFDYDPQDELLIRQEFPEILEHVEKN